MIRYKFDIMQALRDRGYDSKKIKTERILSQATITAIKRGGNITTDTLNRLCIILRVQPSDILEVVPTDEEKIRFF